MEFFASFNAAVFHRQALIAVGTNSEARALQLHIADHHIVSPVGNANPGVALIKVAPVIDDPEVFNHRLGRANHHRRPVAARIDHGPFASCEVHRFGNEKVDFVDAGRQFKAIPVDGFFEDFLNVVFRRQNPYGRCCCQFRCHERTGRRRGQKAKESPCHACVQLICRADQASRRCSRKACRRAFV